MASPIEDSPILSNSNFPETSGPDASHVSWRDRPLYQRLPHDERPLEGVGLTVKKVSETHNQDQEYVEKSDESAGWLDQDGPHAPWFLRHSAWSPAAPYPMEFGPTRILDSSDPNDIAYLARLDLDLYAHRIHVASAIGSQASRHASAQRMLWEAIRGDDLPLLKLALQAGADPQEMSWAVADAAPIHDQTPLSWAVEHTPARPATEQLWIAGGAFDPAPNTHLSGLAYHWVQASSKLSDEVNQAWADRFHRAGLLGVPSCDFVTPLDASFREYPNALAAITAVVPEQDRASIMNKSTHWLGLDRGGHQPARSLRNYGLQWPGLQKWLMSRPLALWSLDDAQLADLVSDKSSCPEDLAPWIIADPLLPRDLRSWITVDGHNEPVVLGQLSLARLREFHPNSPPQALDRSLEWLEHQFNYLSDVLDVLGVPSSDWDEPLVYDPSVDLKGRGHDLSTSSMRIETAAFLQEILDRVVKTSPTFVQALQAHWSQIESKLLNFRSGPYRDLGNSSDHPQTSSVRPHTRKL